MRSPLPAARPAIRQDPDRLPLAQGAVRRAGADLVTAAASGLQGSQLTVFNGAAGVSEVMSQLIGQGASILDTVRHSLAEIEGAPVPVTAEPVKES